MVFSKTEPWNREMWNVSPFNFAKEILSGFPNKVEIHDTTLRDGISDPARGICLTIPQKLEIAQALDDLGVHRIEAGMATDADFESLRTIAHSGLRAPTFAMTTTSALKAEEWKCVDLALKADLSGIVLNFPASEHLVRKYLPGWTMDKVLEKSVEMAIYAKKHGLFVNFFEYDTTRAEPAFLKKLLEEATRDAKVDTVSVVDTLGVGSPAGISYLVMLIKGWVKAPIEVHMHDDFGLGHANALSGIMNGAQIVHTTIDGIGKMPATQDLAVNLQILYGLDMKVKSEKICETCKFIRETGKWSISPYRPIAGELAFAYDSDSRIDENRSQRAPFLPEFVGNKYKIVLTNRTGPQGIEMRLSELGKRGDKAQVDSILLEVKETFNKQKKIVDDKQFKKIVDSVIA